MIYKDNTTSSGSWRTYTYAAPYRSYLTPPSNPFREGKTKLQMLKETLLVLLLAALLMAVLAQIIGKSGKESAQPNKLVAPSVFSEQINPLRGESQQHVPIQDNKVKEVQTRYETRSGRSYSKAAKDSSLRNNDRTAQSISRTRLNEDKKRIEDNIVQEDSSGHHDAIENHGSEEVGPLDEAGNKSVTVERQHKLVEERDKSDYSQGDDQKFAGETIPNETPETTNITAQ